MGRHSKEFKQEAVDIALTSNRSHHEIAVELGINPSTFRNWMSEAIMGRKGSKNKSPNRIKSRSELERELRAMKKELALRQQEVELLKKAAAYFANHQK